MLALIAPSIFFVVKNTLAHIASMLTLKYLSIEKAFFLSNDNINVPIEGFTSRAQV